MRRRLAAIVLAALVVGTTATALTVAAPPAPAAAATQQETAAAIQRIIDDTNAVRAEVGLAPLRHSTAIDAVAQRWTEQQLANNAMSHNPDYAAQMPAGWRRAGENVAYGYSYDTVVAAWKASPGHYQNMVGDFTDIGVGYVDVNGKRFYTQNFGNYASPPAGAAPLTPTTSAAPAPAPSSASPSASPRPSSAVPTSSPSNTSVPTIVPSATPSRGATPPRAVPSRSVPDLVNARASAALTRMMANLRRAGLVR
jgi:hypothetical protein